MADQRVVLVTGVSNYWGGRVAAQLLKYPEWHVIGLDDKAPDPEIKELDFIQAALHNPVLVELLREERIDTVCDLTFVESLRPNEAAFEANVMGTMHLLGECIEAGVRKIVLKSSTLVYGAQPTNSAFLREDHPLHANKHYGYLRDLEEIEAFCNGFHHQYPDTILTRLRFAHTVGPKVDSPMTRFLREEEAFVLLGFDPMMQIIHAEDVVRALVHAVVNDVPGAFNVAAEGVMPLWKLIGLAGKLALPIAHPLAYASVSLLGPRYAPIDLDYLRYPCVGDLHRMRHELGFVPQYTAEETLREFAAQQRLRHYMPESMTRAFEEERLRDTLERRRRARAITNASRARKTRRAKTQPVAPVLTEALAEENGRHE